MRRKAWVGLLVGGWMMWPAGASACDIYQAYTFLGVPSSTFDLGAGINVTPLNGDGDTYLIPSVDVGIRLGSMAVVRPAVGLCNGGDENEIVFGAGGAFNVFNSDDGAIGLNIQAHLARTSYDHGDETAIPVVGAVRYLLNEGTSLYGNAGILHSRFSNGASVSDTNPTVGAGVRFTPGRMSFSAGFQALFADDTNFGLVGGVSIPIG